MGNGGGGTVEGEGWGKEEKGKGGGKKEEGEGWGKEGRRRGRVYQHVHLGDFLVHKTRLKKDFKKRIFLLRR